MLCVLFFLLVECLFFRCGFVFFFLCGWIHLFFMLWFDVCFFLWLVSLVFLLWLDVCFSFWFAIVDGVKSSSVKMVFVRQKFFRRVHFNHDPNFEEGSFGSDLSIVATKNVSVEDVCCFTGAT